MLCNITTTTNNWCDVHPQPHETVEVEAVRISVNKVSYSTSIGQITIFDLIMALKIRHIGESQVQFIQFNLTCVCTVLWQSIQSGALNDQSCHARSHARTVLKNGLLSHSNPSTAHVNTIVLMP